MRTGFLCGVTLLLGTTVAAAQTTPAPESAPATPAAESPAPAAQPTDKGAPWTAPLPFAADPTPLAPAADDRSELASTLPVTPLFDYGGSAGHTDRFWLSAAYAHGWLRPPGQGGIPLLTTGPATAPILGVLGQPGTTTLFGTDDLRYNNLNGVQAEVGFWLDSAQRFSLSVGALYPLQPTHAAYSIASDSNGSSVIARPVLNTVTGAEQTYLVAEPDIIAGNATILSRSELFGAEINAGYHRTLADRLLGTLLFGYRGLHLAEGLSIQDQFQPLTQRILTFEGATVNPPNSLAETARFQTNNEFNGLQLGGKLRWQYDWLFVDAYGKVALGMTDQHVKIDGQTALFTPGAATRVAPGEVLTSLTNIGPERRQVFGAVPECGVNLGVDLLHCLRVKVGYSFLAWSGVARAADQIDRAVNPGRVPTDPEFGNVAGPARPARTFEDHLLWVQTLNVGVELHY